MEKLERHLAAVHNSQHTVSLWNFIINITSLEYLNDDIFNDMGLYKFLQV